MISIYIKLMEKFGCKNIFKFLGVSVLEMVHTFEEATGVKIPIEMAPRRAGDVAASYAACDLAEKELGFKCEYTLFDMCKYSESCQMHEKYTTYTQSIIFTY